MPIRRKPLEIPPAAARQFVADMQAYHAEQDVNRRDEIAAGKRHMLLDHMPSGTKLRVTEVKELFELMRCTQRIACIELDWLEGDELDK
ncbi:hypothetical protein UP10_21715 [Bradyrhizobium sp. LTSPM299]|jgi:hypothetical protein|uniref:hypothetical protein n=1 Tax=Bradyrhizobium sp. LTSPM299 TaxID=1619233 RepID=UPI0005DD5D2B|nr:hypothetical protein [Bradyrhizobium sp. LTSPM299]KJC58915.1 hypothetical protein UP10_21715 [Bradyrhizobium sp. LTSPM299]